jgi:cyclic dehypoxanthinyl futalosine synthase
MSDDWLSVMDVAHRLGLNSTATMMFGHVETVEERIEHLERVRVQQEKSKGFTAFIAWTFQAEHTKLRAPTVGAHEYLRTQALSRIYLETFRTFKAPGSHRAGDRSDRSGWRNDLSIMIEENVVSQAGATFHGCRRHAALCPGSRLRAAPKDSWYRLI